MKTSLKTFLDGLYEIDASLEAHEAELIPLVEKLLASDPAQEPDTEFVKRLRMQLKDRAAELSTPAIFGFSKWLYAFGGAVTAAVIIPVAFISVQQFQRSSVPVNSDLFGFSVSDAGKNAFGSLQTMTQADFMSARPPVGKIAVSGRSTVTNAVPVAAPIDALVMVPAYVPEVTPVTEPVVQKSMKIDATAEVALEPKIDVKEPALPETPNSPLAIMSDEPVNVTAGVQASEPKSASSVPQVSSSKTSSVTAIVSSAKKTVMPARTVAVQTIAPDIRMMPPIPMTKYVYVYDGVLPELSSSILVYKRKPSLKSVSFEALASSLNLGSIDLSSFDGMNISSVILSQKRPYGYQISLNLTEASVSLDAEWDQWPMSKCTTDACFQAERVKIADVPTEAALIASAQAFIKTHGIDVSSYGAPVVDMQWKREYDRVANTNDSWIPDQIRVLYPLMIEGSAVSDQSGMPFGIAVGVHVKTRRVMNVYGIMSREYLKSQYPGITDTKQITDYLSALDNYSWMTPAEMKKAKTVTVKLGEPVMGYTVYYKYDVDTTHELLIPSLTFPVKDQKGDQSMYRQNIVVPLSVEMLKQQDGGRPMPMEGVRAM